VPGLTGVLPGGECRRRAICRGLSRPLALGVKQAGTRGDHMCAV
jgi:hypothetical protein